MIESHQLDLLTLQYLEALEANDWETVAEIWKQAETDAQLEACLLSLAEGILEEAGEEAQLAEDAEVVRELLQKHFAQRPDPPGFSPLTAGDVVTALETSHRQGKIVLSAEELELITALRQNLTPLPEKKTRREMQAWAEQLGFPGTQHFWREFRQTARLLSMSRNQHLNQMAAREEQARKDNS